MFSFLSGAANTVVNAINSRREYKAAKYNADLQYKSAMESTRLNNEAQMNLAKYQNEYNQRMWEKENEYNSPASQMQRLKDAGLNPALMYTQGSTGNAGPVAPAATPNIDYSRHQAGSQRVFRKLQDISSVFNNAVGMANAYEELRGKRLANEAAAIQNRHYDTYWNYRNLMAMNKFYWNGGIPEAGMDSKIARAIYDKMRGQADFHQGNAAFLNVRDRLIRATIGNIMENTQSTRNMNFMFDKTVRPWVNDTGRWYNIFSSIGDLMKGFGGAFLGSYGGALGKGFGYKSFY